MSLVCLNARFRGRPLTGVERFASEVVNRLGGDEGMAIREIAPEKPLAGLKGHAWEQFVLPRRVGGNGVLFSPCNTGPLGVSRQLVVIHDAAVWDGPENFSRSFRNVYHHLLPRLAKRAAKVATVSEFSRRRLAPYLGIEEEEILVLGNGVGADFSPATQSGTSWDAEREARGGPVFLCVGSMDPRKNLGRLLRAWLILKDSDRIPQEARLQLVGGSNPRNFAGVERVDGTGIEWLGRVDDAELVRRYREADVFIYPSLYEGFGLPPLEAMACGCPVLLSNAASLPEVGGPESEGAVKYFDPQSEAGIAIAIEDYLRLGEKERLAMRDSALARAAKFSWSDISSRISEALVAI